MGGERGRRRRSRSEAVSPTSPNRRLRAVLLWALILCVSGMVFLYGGTKFWASAPFFFIGLLMIAGLQGLAFVNLLRGGGRISPPVGTGLWILLLFYILARALAAPVVPYQAWTEFYQVGAVLLFYISFSDLCNRRSAWKGVAAAVLLLAVLQSMYAIWLHWHESNMVLWLPRPRGYGMRASGTFICPNHFAHLLQIAMILSAALLATPGKNLPLKLLSGYTLLIGTPALALSLSRSGVLGAFAGVGVVVMATSLRKGWRRTLLAFSGLAVGGAAVFAALWFWFEPFRTRIEQAMGGNVRWSQYWPDSWSLIRGEGVWGVGPGVFRHAFEQYRDRFSSSGLYLEYAHNEYLHTLAEYGWPMSLLLAGGILLLLFRLLSRSLKIEEGSRAMVPLAMLGILCGSLVHAVFDFNLHITGNMLVMAMLFGALDGLGLQQGIWKRAGVPERAAKPLPLLAAGFALALALASIPLFMGSLHEYQMDRAAKRHRVEEARTHAAAMRTWAPFHWRGWTQLGRQHREDAYYMRNPAERERLVERSREAYRAALKRNPYDRIALAGLAELRMMQRQWAEALALWSQLEELAPFDVQVKVRKGRALMGMGELEAALEVFQRAASLRRNDPAIQRHIRRARRLLREQAAAGMSPPRMKKQRLPNLVG